jgi:N-acyl-D-amino-acid deacylase
MKKPKQVYARLIMIAMLGLALGLGLIWLKRALTERFDIIIVNGTVVDGTGASAEQKSIGIRGGKIVPLNWEFFAEADRLIDAQGLIVAPGFIDVHTHIEGNIGSNRKNESIAAPNFLAQGITTIITGNCGRSAESLPKFFRQIESQGIAVNVGSLVGHNTIRRQVIGEEARKPDQEEIRKMKQIVASAMRDGALGLSSGLEYAPGIFSQREEIEALAEVVSKYHGVYATHLRDEGNDVIDALTEALQVAKRTRIPVQISHLKWRGRVNWGRSQKLINLIAQAQREGLAVRCDAYPYISSSTSLDILIPRYARAGGSAKLRARLRDSVERQEILDGILAQMKEEGWQDFAFARVANCDFAPQYNGLTIPEITNLLRLEQLTKSQAGKALPGTLKTSYPPMNKNTNDQQQNAENAGNGEELETNYKAFVRSQAETICDLTARGSVQMIYENMSEEDMTTILQFADCMLGSDSGIRTGDGRPHPRGYGTAPRFLSRFVFKHKMLSLEEGIRKMTSLPAETFALQERGKLLPQYWADIAIFDPNAFQDNATYDSPFQPPDGLIYVLINGQVAVEEGRILPVSVGRVLKREF